MITELSDVALEFGDSARKAIAAEGGDEFVQRAEADPQGRGVLVEPLLRELGVWDLEPRRSDDELEAAAALCRSAGYWSIAFPLAEVLSRPADLDLDGLVVIDEIRPAATLGGLGGRWAALTLDGGLNIARPQPLDLAPRKSAFVSELDLEPTDTITEAADVALGLVLPMWTLLGMIDRALDLTRAYVQDREQFGQPLSKFQGVQFQLTDAEVEHIGLEELAKYALWSIETRRAEVVTDALAVRLAAIEAADTVFRITHQLHGAIGFCDETALSWVSRYSQPLRRLPLGLAGTRDALTRCIGETGLVGLFDAAGAER